MIKFPAVKYKKEIIDTLINVVSIPSVKGEAALNMPYGKEVFRALMFMLDTAAHMDLECMNLFGHMGYAEYGAGQEEIAILTHLDVVEAGEGWTQKPFEPVIKDDRIFGRGTIDNKGAAVAALYALHLLQENCVTLNKRVRVYFGCDEETSWQDIDFFKANYKEPDYCIVPDASFPVINREKGVMQMDLHRAYTPRDHGVAIQWIEAGSRANIVPNKAVCKLKGRKDTLAAFAELFSEGSPAPMETEMCEDGIILSVHGKAAHGSAPQEGINAAAYLIAFLNTLPLADGELEKTVYSLSKLIGLEWDGKLLGVKREDNETGALSLNLGAINAKDGNIHVKLDFRLPISTDPDGFFEEVKQKFEAEGLKAEKVHVLKGHLVPEDSKLVETLKEVYREFKGKEAECLLSAGATYARAFENAVAFGPVEAEDSASEHGPDENVAISDILMLTEMLASAVLTIAGSPKEQVDLI